MLVVFLEILRGDGHSLFGEFEIPLSQKKQYTAVFFEVKSCAYVKYKHIYKKLHQITLTNDSFQ